MIKKKKRKIVKKNLNWQCYASKIVFRYNITLHYFVCMLVHSNVDV